MSILSTREAAEAFWNYHVSITRQLNFEKFNLVIGSNGAGKSRFLRALCEILGNAKITPIFLDFSKELLLPVSGTANPDLHATGVAQPPVTLSETLVTANSPLSKEQLADLTGFISEHIDSFFEQLPAMLTTAFTRNRSSGLVAKCNQLLRELIDRTIEITDDDKIVIRHHASARNLSPKATFQELSPGERSILITIFAVLLIPNRTDEFVLLIDEPEAHLHVSALTRLMRELRELPGAHIFVGTHSVALLANCEFQEVIHIENSQIQNPSGQKIANVLESVVGGERNRIFALMSSAGEWEYSSFLARCFVDPNDSVKPRGIDAQAWQLRIAMMSCIPDEDAFRVLDYGAGHCRLANCLAMQSDFVAGNRLHDILQYTAYDPGGVADEPVAPWFRESICDEAVISRYAGQFDMVAAYNVLHEVEARDWVKTLGLIHSLLQPNGWLLLGERRVLSQGERPNRSSGYLVLDHSALQHLYPKAQIVEFTLGSPANSYLITRLPEAPSKQNVVKAIQYLRDESWERVCELRNAERYSHDYAFYCQQHINASIALNQLGVTQEARSARHLNICRSRNSTFHLQIPLSNIFGKFLDKLDALISKPESGILEIIKLKSDEQRVIRQLQATSFGGSDTSDLLRRFDELVDALDPTAFPDYNLEIRYLEEMIAAAWAIEGRIR